MVAVINDDEAEERADMTVMLLALVVVVVVLSRVLRVKSSIMSCGVLVSLQRQKIYFS